MKRALVLAVLSFALPLHAAEEPVVVLVVEGPPEEAEAFSLSVTELLSRMHVQIARTDPEDGDVLAHVHVDLRARHLALEGKHAGRSFERDVAKGESPSIARETLAHEIRAGVEAQVFEEERLAAQAPPPPPPPPPLPVVVPPAVPPPAAPPPPAPSRWRFDLGALVAGGPIAEHGGVAPRFGGLVAVGYDSRLAPTVTFSAAYAPSFTVGPPDPVRASVWLVPLRLAPSLALLRTRRLDVLASAGVGLDLVHVAPQSDTIPTSHLEHDTLRADPVVTAALGVRVYATRQISVYAAPGVDFDLATRPYVTQRGHERDVVFEPWRARPTLTIGFVFGLIGGSP